MGIFDLWIDVLTKPAKTFKRMKGKGGLREGAMYLIVASIIAAALEVGPLLADGTWAAEPPVALAVGIVLMVLVLSPLMMLFRWLVVSGIFLLFSRLLGGKGKYAMQSWLIALYSAPVLVIGAVLGLIPFVSGIVDKILWAYGIILLAIALRETHGLTNKRVTLLFLISFFVFFAIALVALFVFNISPDLLTALL